MSTIVRQLRKGRVRLSLALAIFSALVIGLPWVELTEQAEASNPPIAPAVTLTATTENPLTIPNDADGNPISVPASLVVTVAEEITFKAKGVPSGGTYRWTTYPIGSGGNPPFYWKFSTGLTSSYFPADANGESITRKRFAIPGIYRARVVYSYPNSTSVAAYVTVMVVDHTRVNFATNEYAPGDGQTGKPWTATPEIYPAYNSNYDSDFDGLPDAWETTHFGNLAQVWSGDPDSDGLNNARELAMGTDPNHDRDHDGIANADDRYPDDFYNGIMPVLSVSGNMQVKVASQDGVPVSGAPLQLTRVFGSGYFQGGASTAARTTSSEGLVSVEDYVLAENDVIKVTLSSAMGVQNVWLPANSFDPSYVDREGGGSLFYMPPSNPPPPVDADPSSGGDPVVLSMENYLDYYADITRVQVRKKDIWENYFDPDVEDYEYHEHTTETTTRKVVSVAGSGVRTIDSKIVKEATIDGESSTETESSNATVVHVFKSQDFPYELNGCVPSGNEDPDSGADESKEWSDYWFWSDKTTVDLNIKLANLPSGYSDIKTQIAFVGSENEMGEFTEISPASSLRLSQVSQRINVGPSSLPVLTSGEISAVIGPFITSRKSNIEGEDGDLPWDDLENNAVGVNAGVTKRLALQILASDGWSCGNMFAIAKWRVESGDPDWKVSFGDEVPTNMSAECGYGGIHAEQVINIRHNDDAPANDASFVKISFTSSTGRVVVEKVFNVYVRSDSSSDSPKIITAAITNDEAASPRYRKIGLTGVPLADEKPQAEKETDEENEETYVDALTRELRHSTTDVYVPVPASELALSVRRNVASEIWSQGSGLAPSEDPTLAFGSAWRSNLCPHIRIVEQVSATGELVATMDLEDRKLAGVGQADPNYAFVTDEDGSTHRFAIGYRSGGSGSADRYFIPMPTSRHEQDAYQMSLVQDASGSLVFSKKFGNALHFSGAPQIDFKLSANRIIGSKQYQNYEYHRLATVSDRYGNRLVYGYSGGQNLVPSTISVDGRPDLAIKIVQDSSGKVTRVYDPNGNETVYSYDATPGSWPTLTSVVQGGAQISGYGYKVWSEPDYRASAIGSTGISILPWDFREGYQHAQYAVGTYHVDVSAITDGYGNTTSFVYAPDLSFSTYTSEATYNANQEPDGSFSGNYTLAGIPPDVAEIHLPGNRLVRIGGSAGSGRTTTVHDAKNQIRTYSWANPYETMIDQQRLGYEYSDSSVSTAKYRYYQTLTISHQGGGSETYDFNLSAGLALKQTTDHSGNITRFGYGEDLAGGALTGGVSSDITGVLGFSTSMKFSEPTSQTDALNRVTRYAYGPYRVMNTMIDPANIRTDYGVDTLGRRTLERVTNAAGEVLKETAYAYENSTFPAFITKQTVRNVGKYSAQNPPWVGEMTVIFEADNNGRVQREATDMNGNGVIDQGDLVSSYTYDRCGNRVSAINPKGLTTWFGYDSRHRLVNVSYPDGTSKRTVYDKRGGKVLEVDENGHASGYVYDEGGRLVKSVRDMNGNLAANANAASVSAVLTGIDGGTDLIEETVYDAISLPIRKIDARGYVVVTVYDHLQRPARTITPGVSRAPGVIPSDREIDQVTEFFYDGQNPGSSCFNVSGFKPTRIVDPRGFTSYFFYDSLYRAVGERKEFSSGKFAQTSKSYDPVSGVLTDEYVFRDPVDANGAAVGTGTPHAPVRTHTEYDELKRPIIVKEGYETAIEGSIETRYTSTGLAHKSIRKLSATEVAETDTEYDPAGRPVRSTGPLVAVDGTTTLAHPVTLTRYTATGLPAETVDARGHVTTFTYDARDRLIQTIAPAVYDPETFVTATPITTSAYDRVGNAIAVTDPLGNTTKTSYDAANRPETVTSPAYTDSHTGQQVIPVTRNDYDLAGNVVKVTDPNGSVTINTYDSLGRLSETKTNPTVIASENSHPDDIVTAFEYDKAGNQVRVVDGENQITAFEFDGLNRSTATHWDADDVNRRRTNTTEYDAAVSIATVDARNVRIDVQYDARLRATGSTCVDFPGDNETRAYDLASRLTAVSYTDPADLRGVSYQYDKLDRVIEETSAGSSHRYGYDLVGNRTVVEYLRTGRKLVSTYDALNRVENITESLSGSTGERISSYCYDLAGRTLQRSQPNGVAEISAYDPLGRRYLQQTLSSGGSLPVSSFSYRYDAVGNILGIEERYGSTTIADRNITNTYDRVYRLKLESAESLASSQTHARTTATEYEYDRANNRTLKTVTIHQNGQLVSQDTATAVYGNAANGKNSNQLVSYDDTATGHFSEYTYDANGNRLTKSLGGVVKESYVWDGRNRLTGLVQDGGTKVYRYAYDYRMRRVERDESGAGGESSVCSYSGGTSVIETAGTAVKVEYIRGSDYGGGVGGILYSVRDGQEAFNAYNSRGDVVAQTNSNGSVTWEATYEAFGTRTTESGTNLDRQKANTKEEDPTGLLNEGFRYRDLATGMFISRDPAGFVDGPNVYTYVRQNPWTMFDPLGLQGGPGQGRGRGGKPANWDANGGWGGLARSTGASIVSGLGRGVNGTAHGVVQAVNLVDIGWREGANALGANIDTDGAYARAEGTTNHLESYNQEIRGAQEEIWNAKVNTSLEGVAEVAAPDGVAFLKGGKILIKGLSKVDNAASLTGTSARVISERVTGVADDALVHFGPEGFDVIKPAAGGDFSHAFRYGDIKDLTQAQVEGLIGPLAQSGAPGGSRFMHVLDNPSGVAKESALQGSDIPEYTFRGETKVEKAHDLAE